jgi:7-carboxy-7-deazaguanine synthase
METAEVIGVAAGFPGADHATITGGEPLLQEGVYDLMDGLLDAGWRVQIETNGSLGLEGIKSGVRKIVDVKTPSTGESGSFLMENIRLLGVADEVKFPIGNAGDYGFSVDFMKKHLSGTGALINFSPVYGIMDAGELARMMLRDGVTARLNIQVHKYIGVE